jgi:hypothetical protein
VTEVERSDEGPSVLIVGGFATVPPNYWPLRRRLLDRGAARVDIAPIWLHDWALAGVIGLGRILRTTGRAISRTHDRGGRRPIMVIGHSGGGVASRLAMSTVPYRGHHAGAADAVGCLVTLGTPHDLHKLRTRYRHKGHEALEFLERESPGAFHSPRTRYLTIGGILEPKTTVGLVRWATEQAFSVIIGEQLWDPGDGIVPASAAHLKGAERINVRGASHGTLGRRWYGSAEVIDEWWPTAFGLWKEAALARFDTKP